ncbi:MAG: histidinol-phosphate transaminase [Candidatus Coproplasma sp.]
MSRFCSEKLNLIEPYVPGEQLKDKKYIKLNTNENPFYTSDRAVERVTRDVLSGLNRYSDPESKDLHKAIADFYGLKSENVLVTNGSDEALAFAFIAYGKNVCYPDVTYGFYEVLANLFDCNAQKVALNDDFTITPSDYFNANKTVVIANPNAQTGIALSLCEIEEIIKNNLDNIVIIDQAYVDFGEGNAIDLISKYNNLLVINTFSKSRSLAGARVGFAIADEQIIDDLKKVKNSFHPYNVNSVSSALAIAAMNDREYFENSVKCVKISREKLTHELKKLGFSVLPSSANFVLAKSDKISGEELYLKLKDNGVLVRYFSSAKISDYVRITIGTDLEMQTLIEKIKLILGAK